MNRYRLWKKDGTYEIGVGTSKDSAKDYAIARKKIKESQIVNITIVRGR